MDADIHHVENGVPHGGILITLLFLIMINDLHKALKFTHVLEYANDTATIVTSQNLRSITIKINKI